MRDIITGQTPEGIWFAQDGDMLHIAALSVQLRLTFSQSVLDSAFDRLRDVHSSARSPRLFSALIELIVLFMLHVAPKVTGGGKPAAFSGVRTGGTEGKPEPTRAETTNDSWVGPVGGDQEYPGSEAWLLQARSTPILARQPQNPNCDSHPISARRLKNPNPNRDSHPNPNPKRDSNPNPNPDCDFNPNPKPTPETDLYPDPDPSFDPNSKSTLTNLTGHQPRIRHTPVKHMPIVHQYPIPHISHTPHPCKTHSYSTQPRHYHTP